MRWIILTLTTLALAGCASLNPYRYPCLQEEGCVREPVNPPWIFEGAELPELPR